MSIFYSENNKYSKAFSLMEATIVMGMVAVFFAISYHVITQKKFKTSVKSSHGTFECYVNASGERCQRYTIDSVAQTEQCGVSYCEFEPPLSSGISADINLVGMGGINGGEPGDFYNSRVNALSSKLYLFVPTPSNVVDGATLMASTKEALDDVLDGTENDTVISANAGRNGLKALTYSDFSVPPVIISNNNGIVPEETAYYNTEVSYTTDGTHNIAFAFGYPYGEGTSNAAYLYNEHLDQLIDNNIIVNLGDGYFLGKLVDYYSESLGLTVTGGVIKFKIKDGYTVAYSSPTASKMSNILKLINGAVTAAGESVADETRTTASYGAAVISW